MKEQTCETLNVMTAWADIPISTQAIVKLKSAETRLKAPLVKLMSRWVVDEKVALNTICLKLDVSLPILYKLISHFGLEEPVAANKLKYAKSSALRDMIIKKSQLEQRVYR